ncbi:MAG: ATP-binding protein, partial [Solirubrobacterales bacterium]|nr:ATP-binding protein [Solirubrobacterales bacterium]
MDPALNPYAPGAGTRPPVLTGRDAEIDVFRVAIARLAAGRPARSVVLSGLRGVGKTVLLNEFDVIGREAGWVTSDVVECNEDDTLGELMARLAWRALRRLSRGKRLSSDVRRALGVLKAFTVTADSHGRWALNLDVDAVSGTADSGDLEHDIVELLDAVGRAATAKASGMLILLDELQFLGRDDLRRLAGAFHRMSQEEHPVLMAAAGLPQLPLALAQAKPYSERLFTDREVGSLRPAAARAALLTPATRAGVRFSDAALKRVIAASSGYPYFLQQWGEAVWNEAVGSEIT